MLETVRDMLETTTFKKTLKLCVVSSKPDLFSYVTFCLSISIFLILSTWTLDVNWDIFCVLKCVLSICLLVCCLYVLDLP